MHAVRVIAGVGAQGRQPIVDERASRPIQQRAGDRGARRVVRVADCRWSDDQERRPAEERADAVCHREHSHRAGRSAARVPIPTPRRAFVSSNSCCRGCKRVPGVEAATLSDGLPAAGNGSIPVQIEGKAYRRTATSRSRARGSCTAGYFDTFQTKLVSGREFTTRRHRDEPARRDHQRIVCADAFSARRSGRPPDSSAAARHRRSRG